MPTSIVGVLLSSKGIMKFSSTILVLAGFCLEQVSAVTWYFLRWYTPDTSAEFLEVCAEVLRQEVWANGSVQYGYGCSYSPAGRNVLSLAKTPGCRHDW
jgi:hypothetical protein